MKESSEASFTSKKEGPFKSFFFEKISSACHIFPDLFMTDNLRRKNTG